MLKFENEVYVNGVKTNDLTKIVTNLDKYFEKLQKKLDEIGEIVVSGIKEGIMSRNYPGGDMDVQRGGTPLYNTGQLYNSITKQRVNGEEVDVFINGNRSKIGMYQQQKGREFWGIYESTEQKINQLLQQIVSDTN